jgi:hypothetical protein
MNPMSEHTKLFERSAERYEVPDLSTDGLLRRRDRRRRNQRIAAGVVGIAVFVAAVWIVTSVSSLDRSETSVGPAGDVTGPAETGPAEAAPRLGPPYGKPDVHRRGECHPSAGLQPNRNTIVWLELWDLGDRIRARLTLWSTKVGGLWRVVFRHTHIPAISPPEVVFQGTTGVPSPGPSAGPGGAFKIIRYVTDFVGVDGFQAKAVDEQTGWVCRGAAPIG